MLGEFVFVHNGKYDKTRHKPCRQKQNNVKRKTPKNTINTTVILELYQHQQMSTKLPLLTHSKYFILKNKMRTTSTSHEQLCSFNATVSLKYITVVVFSLFTRLLASHLPHSQTSFTGRLQSLYAVSSTVENSKFKRLQQEGNFRPTSRDRSTSATYRSTIY